MEQKKYTREDIKTELEKMLNAEWKIPVGEVLTTTSVRMARSQVLHALADILLLEEGK